MEYDAIDKRRMEVRHPCLYEITCTEPAKTGQKYCDYHLWIYSQRHSATTKNRSKPKTGGFSKRVLKRAEDKCEACQIAPYSECDGVATQAHHIVQQSVNSKNKNSTENGLAVSAVHHKLIHSEAYRSQAIELGLLKESEEMMKLDLDDLEEWVANDEGLYNWQQASGLDEHEFVIAHQYSIRMHVVKMLNREPG